MGGLVCKAHVHVLNEFCLQQAQSLDGYICRPGATGASVNTQRGSNSTILFCLPSEWELTLKGKNGANSFLQV